MMSNPTELPEGWRATAYQKGDVVVWEQVPPENDGPIWMATDGNNDPIGIPQAQESAPAMIAAVEGALKERR
jgi:hypothetical protein